MAKKRSDKLTERRERVQRNLDAAKKFGELLKQHRLDRGLSLRNLGLNAGLPHQNIDEMERAQRPCGPRAAERLAESLALFEGAQGHRDFLYAAAATMKVASLIAEARDFPPEILDAVASRLRAMGIRGADVVGATLFTPDGQARAGGADLEVRLRDKRVVTVTISSEVIQ